MDPMELEKGHFVGTVPDVFVDPKTSFCAWKKNWVQHLSPEPGSRSSDQAASGSRSMVVKKTCHIFDNRRNHWDPMILLNHWSYRAFNKNETSFHHHPWVHGNGIICLQINLHLDFIWLMFTVHAVAKDIPSSSSSLYDMFKTNLPVANYIIHINADAMGSMLPTMLHLLFGCKI